LWPPNHKLAEVCATVEVTDICDPEPTYVLSSITSDEPDNDFGDGNTVDDIQDEELGTPDTCYLLRSERQGIEDGRVYTIIYCASDESGNTACDTFYVRVPHDQSAGAASSAGYIADGRGFASDADQFAVIVPSTGGLDAASLDRSRLYIGNTAGVALALSVRVVELNSDGRPDLAVFFSTESALEIIGASADPQDLGSSLAPLGRKPLRDDGPLGLHFVSPTGVDYLVADLFALGPPVPMPDVWLEDPPVPFSQPGDDEPGVGAGRGTGFTSIHPNPFNPQVTVDFALSNGGLVRIAVYDVRGALVRRLTDGILPPGDHSVTWNGVDERGGTAASGIYFVRLIAGSYSETRKIVMLK
ncbi:MAG: T9SS C-terminal target domain-containing protein, partial [Acidobacteria bacterium]